MTKLKEIQKDLLKARKEKDQKKIGLLTALYSEALAVGKNNGNRDSTDEEVLAMVQKFKKNVLSNIELVKDGDKLEELKAELEILEGYLPKQLTEDEIVAEIGVLLGTDDSITIGDVMKHFKANYSGRYDGKELSKIAREVLN